MSYETGNAYICLSCHTTLTQTNIGNPIVPYYVMEGKLRDGANFLKALNEKPEYVCTCCHQLLFHKTVRNVLINEYDYTNEIVQKSLAHRYTSEQNVINIFNCTFGRTEDEPSEVNISSENLGHANGGNEFICVCCRNSLGQKNQKCLIRYVQIALI